MIVKIYRGGSSFKGLAQYLTHDVGAETSKRVAWTHTLNCVNEDVPSAIDEMLWTYRGADYLKNEAGIRAGGRPVEEAVKHASLNWHPSESPTREHMVATAEDFLKDMGWQDHEAVLIAHQDKEHRHVHIMLNRVSPIDGTVLDEGFEHRRAQEWAKQYELEQGRVFCTQRLLPEENRTPSPTRATWEALRESEQQNEQDENIRRKFDREYFAREENSKIIQGEEWKILKAHQREEREAYFVDGKHAFNDLRTAIFREVREEFREEWSDYYLARRKGMDADELNALRTDILDRQKEALDERRTEASDALRAERDIQYRELLDSQKEERSDLRTRQEDGLRSPHLLDHVNEPRGHDERANEYPSRWQEISDSENGPTEIAREFRAAAAEIVGRDPEYPAHVRDEFPDDEYPGMTAAENPRVRDGANMAADLGGGLIGALAGVGEGLFDSMFGSDAPRQPAPEIHRPAPPPKEHWQNVRDNPFMRVAEAARQEAIRQEEESRNRAYWDDRDRDRGRE